MKFGVFVLLFLVGMYLVPTIIAWIRGHDQKVAITALNVLLGWSVLGWIGALVWSLMTPQRPQPTVIVQAPHAH